MYLGARFSLSAEHSETLSFQLSYKSTDLQHYRR